MWKRFAYWGFVLIAVVIFCSIWTGNLLGISQSERLNEDTITSIGYREQNVGEDMFRFLEKQSSPGKYVGIYLLESKYGYQEWKYGWTKDDFLKLEKKWKKQSEWSNYIETTKAIWNDVKFFPIPKSTSDIEFSYSYVNTWMSERNYGGKRGHEGTDIMAGTEERGLYPIVSMTDGIVTKKGWLEKGGYRIGVESPNGTYFYYAHLDSYANIEEGDSVKAGDILGFMGDSGYGEEGTVGQFPVHLHLGIYIYPEGKEMSINPYWILRYIENRKVKCYTEI